MPAIARDAGMRIVGPNCLGLANIHNNVYAAFGSITRPPQLQRGSGGSAIVFADAAEQSGLAFSTFGKDTKQRLAAMTPWHWSLFLESLSKHAQQKKGAPLVYS